MLVKININIQLIYYVIILAKYIFTLSQLRRNVKAMADYAFDLRTQLENVNQHSWNDFKLKIGLYYIYNYSILK